MIAFHTPIYRIVFLAVVSVAAAIPFTGSGCKKAPPSINVKVSETKSALERMISNILKAAPEVPNPEQRYLIAGYRSGVNRLDRYRHDGLTRPVLMTAVLCTREKGTHKTTLLIQWLDLQHDVAGIYLTTREGEVLVDAPREFDWDKGTREWLSETAFRQTIVPIALDEEGVRSWHGTSTPWPMLKIDIPRPRVAVNVGLITRDGNRTEPVKAFICQEDQ